MQNRSPRSGLMLSLLVAVTCLSTAALADNFGKRVAEAQKASSTPEGKAYDQALGPAVDATMRVCLPPGSTEVSASKFALVGYVAPDGVISAVEVQPRTEVAQCFAAKFQQTRFAPPPASGTSQAGFPIAVEMSVLP